MNITLKVRCRCGQEYSVSAEFAGQSVNCTRCSHLISIPAATPDADHRLQALSRNVNAHSSLGQAPSAPAFDVYNAKPTRPPEPKPDRVTLSEIAFYQKGLVALAGIHLTLMVAQGFLSNTDPKIQILVLGSGALILLTGTLYYVFQVSRRISRSSVSHKA